MDAREMQVEFERRLILINPAFELIDKLPSDTIFSFLNAYCQRYVKINYLQEDIVVDGTRAQKKNADSLKGLIVRTLLKTPVKFDDNSDLQSTRFLLPEDYFLYIRSNSKINSNYKTGILSEDAEYSFVTPNKTVREDDVEKIIGSYYNKPILRNPYVVLNSGDAVTEKATDNVYINVIHDSYTTVGELDLVYYRLPRRFDVLNVNNGVDPTDPTKDLPDGIEAIYDRCELPDNVHMEIVEGAVEMFITENKYRLSAPRDNG